MAIVDYESDYEEADKVKYLNYLTGIANRYLQEKKECPILRMIVIYTGDITRRRVNTEYNIGALKLSVEPAFLSELHSEEIYQRLKEKVKQIIMYDKTMSKMKIVQEIADELPVTASNPLFLLRQLVYMWRHHGCFY